MSKEGQNQADTRRKLLRLGVGATVSIALPALTLMETALAFAAPRVLSQQQETPAPANEPKKVPIGAVYLDGLFSPTRKADLKFLADAGFSSVRVIATYMDHSASQAAKMLSGYLDLAEEVNLDVDVVLASRYGNQGHFSKEMLRFYNAGQEPNIELGHLFYASINFEDHPFPRVAETIINANRGRVREWVIGNEFYETNPAIMIPFLEKMTGVIKRADPKTPVKSGLVSSANIKHESSMIYGPVRNLEPSANTYNNAEDGPAAKDADRAREIGIPFEIGEFGFDFDPNSSRAPKIRAAIIKGSGLGAESMSLFGLVPPHKKPDKILGISPQNNDYKEILQEVRSQG